MNANNKLEKNVSAFLYEASQKYGKIKADDFSQELHSKILEQDINSPIEQIFYIAFNLMTSALQVEINPAPYYSIKHKDYQLGYGVFIKPQFNVGKYRVDFLISQNIYKYKDLYPPVIVELDGHQFHDMNKDQRSYEKARDRYLIKQGYKVLHFTGSDVVRNPIAVVCEAIELIGLNEYDPTNNLEVE